MLAQSLGLLQRYFDELNADLESANARASVALTAVAALTGIAIFQVDVVSLGELDHLGKYWLLVLIVASLAFAALILGAYEFICSLWFADSLSPYNLKALKAQALSPVDDPEGVYFSDSEKFLRLQIDYHYFAIQARKKLVDRKVARFNSGLKLSIGGFLTLVLLKVLGFVVAMLAAYG